MEGEKKKNNNKKKTDPRPQKESTAYSVPRIAN